MKILNLINQILIKQVTFDKQPNRLKNVLVVSNTGLGDTILSSPAIKTLRKSFPDIKITFMINEMMYPLYKEFDYVDDFILYRTGILNQLKIVHEIRQKKIDTIFLFHSNGPEDVFFSMLSGATNILKVTDNLNHPFKKIFLNQPNLKHQHIIETKIDLVRLYAPKVVDSTMEIGYVPKIEKRGDKNRKIIGLQVGTQDLYKIWPIEKFIRLAQELDKEGNVQFVLLGATPLEKRYTDRFMKEVKSRNSIINVCCKTSITELADTIKNLDLLITNDTGALHLAIALKVPTISLFGPTDHKVYGPYQDIERHTVIQKDGFFVNNKPKKQRGQEGIDLIEVKEVVDAYRQFEKKRHND